MWVDDKGKKSKISAPQYVDYVMTYVQKVVNDETVFPTKHGNEFPANFDVVLKKVQKLRQRSMEFVKLTTVKARETRILGKGLRPCKTLST